MRSAKCCSFPRCKKSSRHPKFGLPWNIQSTQKCFQEGQISKAVRDWYNLNHYIANSILLFSLAEEGLVFFSCDKHKQHQIIRLILTHVTSKPCQKLQCNVVLICNLQMVEMGIEMLLTIFTRR